MRDNTLHAITVKSGTSVFNADSCKKQEQNFMEASKLVQQAKKCFVPIIEYGTGQFRVCSFVWSKLFNNRRYKYTDSQ